MNFTQLQAYLKAYLETNDSAVIDQIPNFMTLALARISAELRGVVAEVAVDLLPEPTQPQPKGFMGAALLIHDGMVSEYVSPAAFAGLTNEPGAYYTLLAGQISVYPEPTSTTLLTLTYYQATGDNMSASLPHLLLHCAAAEAEMFQGNLQDAATEIQLYQNDMGSANGWDIQSGPITLGGGLRVAQGAVGSTNTPGTGYVKGPATATAGNLAQWDGTTGKLLSNGLPVSTFAAAADLGTAAFATLTTSTTDGTVGRVTRIGDFGLGGVAIDATALDCNNLIVTGDYAIASGTTNGPGFGSGLHVIQRSIGLVVQLALGSTRAAMRTYNSGVWGAWVEIATASNSIGQSQTWQNLNASRALSTTYTNTTGRPIQVQAAIGFSSATAASVIVQVAGVNIGAAGGVTSAISSVSFIVPNGATYAVSVFAGTGQSIIQWGELR